MISETDTSRRELHSTQKMSLAYLYGLFAVLVVASVQVFFSLYKGGYFAEQLYWGAGVVVALFVVAALVPGYLSSIGRKQWVLAGTLLLLTAVVAASISWSISPRLSSNEALRTAMYAGAFVVLLPAAARWGALVVDATVFGALLPPALFGLLQKIVPFAPYTGFATPETDPKVHSTIGYHPTFGLMCAMGALLLVARMGSFRSIRSIPLRLLYSATCVTFLVTLYFSFSRGAVLAFVVGAVVLLIFSKHRFEALGNLAIVVVPALWIASQAREYPGLVTRPASAEAIATGGLHVLPGLLLKGVLLALAAQVLFSVLVRAFVKFVPEGMRGTLRIAGAVIGVAIVAGGLFIGWNAFQQAGGFDELKGRIMADDSQLQAEARAQDQTQRLSSPSAANRIAYWKIAWENWREHPFTGTGGDTYQVVYKEMAPEGAQSVKNPHSMWMSLLSDTGIFAFLAFAAFCVGGLALASYNAFSGMRSSRSRALIAGSAAAATAYFVSSSIDWNWYIPASTLPYFALAAVAAGTTRRSVDEATPAQNGAPPLAEQASKHMGRWTRWVRGLRPIRGRNERVDRIAT